LQKRLSFTKVNLRSKKKYIIGSSCENLFYFRNKLSIFRVLFLFKNKIFIYSYTHIMKEVKYMSQKRKKKEEEEEETE
jgi:hypothetical protein